LHLSAPSDETERGLDLWERTRQLFSIAHESSPLVKSPYASALQIDAGLPE